ncbi:MAG: hypothetical protein JW874_15280 [Spirochaetales bacterium]|nr:hypothetical protein [Spirochaetales bacterium]
MSDYEDPLAIRQYLLSLMTEAKKLKTEIIAIGNEIQLWMDRVTLAAEKQLSDLQAGAQVKLAEVKQTLETRTAEKAALDREIADLKRKLLVMKGRPEMSVDADLLLSQFEMLLGETDELEQKFKSEEADSMLDELKKKIDE